ncbi:MAG: hypothetical protein IJ526_04610 [Lachnospiraceae bacterium]|nr:hypothetical protein [Lachnospiraceae bacterium]
MKAFNLLALDENYEIIGTLRPSNVQWNRKYHEAGHFTIQLPVSQYNKSVKYIYTKDRPELGIVKKTSYLSVRTKSYIQLFGYFLESKLARMIVYPKGTTNITNSPSWEEYSGKAEDVAFAFFNAFKALSTQDGTIDIGVTPGTSLGRGKDSVHQRNGEDLAWKIYDILKPSGMSYRVDYDLNTGTQEFNVWTGKDRTQDNTDGNNPVIFSTVFGNVDKPNIVLDDLDYRNGCIVCHETVDHDETIRVVRAVINEDTDDRCFTYIRSKLNKSEYSAQDFITAMDQEGHKELLETVKEINIEFDAIAGSYEYGVDFDLGDLCSVEIVNMGLTADVRLIGCYEVMKEGTWTMSMEFGTPMNIDIRR